MACKGLYCNSVHHQLNYKTPSLACSSESLSSGRTDDTPKNPQSPAVLPSGYKLLQLWHEDSFLEVEDIPKLLKFGKTPELTLDKHYYQFIMMKMPCSSRVPCHLQRSFTNITHNESSHHPKSLASPYYERGNDFRKTK